MSCSIFLKRKIKRIISYGFKSKEIGWGIVIFLIIIAFSIYNLMLLPQIRLNGKKNIIIDYQENYKEMGAKASFLGTDYSKSITIKGDVNSNKLGLYKIRYKIVVGTFSKEVIRKVYVRDRKKPKIFINNKDIYLCPGDKVVPSLVKAIDNYDGDISNRVKINILNDKIIYSVSDKSGNKREIVKNIIYKDIKKPKIKLKGNYYMYLFLGDIYKEPGYEVEDNCDLDIKDKVKINNNVNTNKIGEYEIIYTVKDKANNLEKVTRKVKVSEKNNAGTIYLTFDDGPKSGTTDIILDILKEEGIKATFFVTGRGEDYLIKRIYDEDHSIGLHTATHDYSYIYSSIGNYFNDLNRVQNRVKRITGYESKIIRFPGGSSNTVSRKYSEGIMSNLTQEVINRGFKYFDWNISSGDAEWGEVDTIKIKNNVINNLRKDRVNMVLMHDVKNQTKDCLKDIIKYGKDNGFIFDKITMDTDMIKQKINN